MLPLPGQGRTSEFHYGRFERAFMLPANVDAEKVVASYDNGMLELSLPLAEAAKPRRIAIGTGDSAASVGHAASARDSSGRSCRPGARACPRAAFLRQRRSRCGEGVRMGPIGIGHAVDSRCVGFGKRA